MSTTADIVRTNPEAVALWQCKVEVVRYAIEAVGPSIVGDSSDEWWFVNDHKKEDVLQSGALCNEPGIVLRALSTHLPDNYSGEPLPMEPEPSVVKNIQGVINLASQLAFKELGFTRPSDVVPPEEFMALYTLRTAAPKPFGEPFSSEYAQFVHKVNEAYHRLERPDQQTVHEQVKKAFYSGNDSKLDSWFTETRELMGGVTLKTRATDQAAFSFDILPIVRK